jgi:hypothetical protein
MTASARSAMVSAVFLLPNLVGPAVGEWMHPGSRKGPAPARETGFFVVTTSAGKWKV